MSNQNKKFSERFPEDVWKIIKSYMVIPKPTTCVKCSGENPTINKKLYSFPDTKNCGNIVDKDNKIKKFKDYKTYPRKDRTLDYDSLEWYYTTNFIMNVSDREEQDKIRQSVLTSKLVYNLPIIKWYCVYCYPMIEFSHAEEYLETQYPKEYPNEHKNIFYKKVDKEFDLHQQYYKENKENEDPYLFRTHRLKKTQDKIKFYFDLIFKKEKSHILKTKRQIEKTKTILVTLQQEQIIRNNKKLRKIKVERMNTIMNEIILRKVAILFTAKKISYKTYTHIMNFIFDDSNNNRERENFIFSWENIIIKFNLEPSTLNDVLPHIVL